jgi:type I restriction enzyme, S subunit
MSSESVDAVTGKSDQVQGSMLTLRFPIFADRPLHDICLGDVTEEGTIRNKGKLSTDVIMGVSKDLGMVPMQAHVIADDIARYKIVQKDWFAYNPMRLNIGSIARWQNDADALVSPDYVVFHCPKRQKEPSLLPTYLDHFRRSTQWDAFTNEAGDGGVRVRIYYRDIAHVRLLLPDSDEQQKIADCLSSLDAVIAAEGDRLAALKAHKMGLMQQLFPAKDQIIPRLRFPEFESAGAWEVKPLADIFDTSSGGTPDRQKKEYWDGQIPWVTTSLIDSNVVLDAAEFITVEGLKSSSAKLFPKGTVLVAMYGQGKTRGKVALLGIEAATNQACAAILPKDGIDPAYVFLNLCSRYHEIRGLSNSGGQDNLSQGIVGTLSFPLPLDENEQRKVANCLSSLDAIVTAQSDKLDALKAQKNGLMQQLFPTPVQATA